MIYGGWKKIISSRWEPDLSFCLCHTCGNWKSSEKVSVYTLQKTHIFTNTHSLSENTHTHTLKREQLAFKVEMSAWIDGKIPFLHNSRNDVTFSKYITATPACLCVNVCVWETEQHSLCYWRKNVTKKKTNLKIVIAQFFIICPPNTNKTKCSKWTPNKLKCAI